MAEWLSNWTWNPKGLSRNPKGLSPRFEPCSQRSICFQEHIQEKLETRTNSCVRNIEWAPFSNIVIGEEILQQKFEVFRKQV